MSEKKPYIDNSGFKEFIEFENSKRKRPAEENNIDLLPFIEFEMDRINKVTKLFSKLKQHQIYPHLKGLINTERKKNFILRKKILDKLKNESSPFLKNIDQILRKTFN